MCGCTVSRGRRFGVGWVGRKKCCTLWIREAVTPNWSFWGNLGLAGSLDLAALITQAQHKFNNHLMGRSAPGVRMHCR